MPITNIINIEICGYNPPVFLITIELPASWMNAGSCKHPISANTAVTALDYYSYAFHEAANAPAAAPQG